MESLTFPLYLLKTSPGELNFWDRTYNFDIYIKSFLKTGIKKDFKSYTQYENSKVYKSYQKYVGYYAKTVWLTKEYFENNKVFKYPLGLKLNNNGKWDIHPGGHRNTVIYYFPNNTILGLSHLKTGSYVEVFNSCDELKTFFNTSDIGIEFNTSPEVHINSSFQYKLINDTRTSLKHFFNTTFIDSNFDLDEWGYNKNKLKKIKKHIKVTVSDQTDTSQIIRAFLLMPNFDSFNDYDVKIENLG